MAVFGLIVGLAGGCSDTKPRSLEEIEQDRLSLPALYLNDSGQEVIAPGNRGLFVDEASGEIAWPAYTCTNPDCPGEPSGGRKEFVFTWPDPRYYVAEDGTLGTREYDAAEWLAALKEMGGHEVPTCPACLEQRDLGQESRAEIEKYRLWVEPYVLPGTDERLAALAAEKQQRAEYIERRLAGD